MAERAKTVAELIEELARQSRQSERFVADIKRLFASKGIALEESCELYEQAIHDAFACERALVHSSQQAAKDLEVLDSTFSKLRGTCKDLVGQVQELRDRVVQARAQLNEEQQRRKEEEEERAGAGLQLPARLIH